MSDDRRLTPGCLDAETLAAFMDGRLTAADRALVEQHLAECEDCYEVWMEAGASNQSNAGAPTAERSKGRWLAGVSVLAASMLAAVWLWPMLVRDPATRALDDLVAAVGTSRFSEARMGFDFAWGDAPSATRGDRDDLPVRLDQAALAATTVAEETQTAFAYRVAAAGHLTRGRYDMAIRALEAAAELAPEDGLVRLDLGASLLERFRVEGRQEDAANGLEATEHAARLLPSDAAAHFNRALALEANGRLEEAVDAWDAYLALDASSAWASEARDRRERLRSRIGGPPLETLANLSRDDLRALATDEPWRLLDYIDRVALPGWLAAVQRGGVYPLTEAMTAAVALQEAGRDRYAHDLLAALSASALEHRDAATALQHLQESRSAFNVSRYADAEARAQSAAQQLTELGLPAADAEMQAAFARYFMDDRPAAIANAARIRLHAEGRGYLRVAARADYMTGQYLTGQVDLERGLAMLERAAAIYDRAGDRAQVAATESQIMFVARSAGQTEESWRRATTSVRLLNATASPRLRYMVLSNLQYHLVESGLFRAALPLTERLQVVVDSWNDPVYSADVALLQIGVHRRIGDGDGVRSATSISRSHAARVTDNDTRAQYDHAIDFAVARAFHTDSPAEAIAPLDRILDRLQTLNRPLLLAEARLLRGRAYAALGDQARAETEWTAGLAAIENERDILTAPHLAVPRADRQWELYAALIAQYRDDHIRSLEVAERARARSLLTRMPGAAMDARLGDVAAWLPQDTTILSYAVLDDALARWTITRTGGVHLDVVALPSGGLEPLVSNFVDALRSGGPAAPSQRLARLLLPTEQTLPGSRLVVIPDGPLHRVPFGALKAGDGQLLIDAVELTTAPSVAWIRQSLAGAAALPERRALLVGFGEAQPQVRLSALPRVATEIEDLRQLYGPAATPLLGNAATADAVTARVGTHTILHIAGHAVADNLRPWESRIFLAPAADRHTLTVADIDRLRLQRGSLVLLSACSTAAGNVFRGEGVVNLARPFLAAGASAVLASLWPVRDDDAARTMVAIHRELLNGASLAAALTTVQRAELQARPNRWQPWMVLGG